jgi:hypothetical protein
VKRAARHPLYGASQPHSVGLKNVHVPGDPGIPLLVLYPTSEPEKPEAFGPFTLSVAKAAPPLAGTHPLVVISHESSART